MREIVERLKENRDIETAKAILESNGYKISKGSRGLGKLKESVEGKGYWVLTISADNAPGTTYYGRDREAVGSKILAKTSYGNADIEVATLGYDDISFIFQATQGEAVKLGKELARVVDPMYDEYDTELNGVAVSITGPYEDPEELDGDYGLFIKVYPDGTVD